MGHVPHLDDAEQCFRRNLHFCSIGYIVVLAPANPLGRLNSNAKSKVAKEVGQPAATITAENLITLLFQIMGSEQEVRGVARWRRLPTRICFAHFISSKNAAGTENVGGEALYISTGRRGLRSFIGTPSGCLRGLQCPRESRAM